MMNKEEIDALAKALAPSVADAITKQNKMTLTKEEVAFELNIAPEHVNVLRKSGKLKGVHYGRGYIYSRKAVEEYLRNEEKKCW